MLEYTLLLVLTLCVKMGSSGSTCNAAGFNSCAPYCAKCEAHKTLLEEQEDRMIVQLNDCIKERKQFRDSWIKNNDEILKLEQRCASPLAGESHNNKVLAKVRVIKYF